MGIIVAVIFLIQMAITLLSALLSVYSAGSIDLKIILNW